MTMLVTRVASLGLLMLCVACLQASTNPTHALASSTTNVKTKRLSGTLCSPDSSADSDAIASPTASILHVGCSAHSTLCREAKAELRQLLQLVHRAPHVHNTTDDDDKSGNRTNRTGDRASDPLQPQATTTALERALTFFCDSGSGEADPDELHPVKEQQDRQDQNVARRPLAKVNAPRNGDFFHESETDPPLSPPPGVQKQRSRSRRNEEDVDHAMCTLSSLLALNCSSPPTAVPTPMLEVIVDADEELGALTTQPDLDFNTTIAAEEYVRQSTASWQPRTLVVSGLVYLKDLVWLLNSGTWGNAANFRLTGLNTPTLCLNIFNPLRSVRNIRISDGHVIHLAQTCSDDEPTFRLGVFLQELRLQRMNIRDIADNTFRNMHLVHTFDFRDNQLTALKNSTLFGLERLRVLLLRDNHISSIEDDAFSGMTQLTLMNLIENDLTQLSERVLLPLSTLSNLQLNNNPINSLAEKTFACQTQLQTLFIDACNLQKLPSDVFQNTTMLADVRLRNNKLTELPQGMLSNLRQLRRLDVNNNALHRVDRLWTGTQHQLIRIQLSHNQLTFVHPSVVSSAPNLVIFLARHNVLTSAVLSSLHDHAQLVIVDASFNSISSIPDDALRNMTRLQQLSLTDNLLTGFPARKLPSLVSLRLSNNPLTAQPDVTLYSQLDELDLTNHRIPHLDATPFLQLLRLHRLEIAAAKDVPPATLSLSNTINLQDLNRLVAVDVRNINVGPLFNVLKNATVFALRELSLGWSGMDETTLSLRGICPMLHDNVARFQLSNTAFTHVRLCDGVVYDAVFLQDNLQLQSVSSVGGVQQLNVSGCPHLQQLHVPSADVLDISGTRVPLFRGLCTSLGTRTFVARNWQTEDLTNTARLQQLLSQCLLSSRVDVLDLSDNPRLDQPGVVEAVVSNVVVLGEEGQLINDDFARLVGRTSVGLLQLADAPTTCQLQFLDLRIRQSGQIRHARSQGLGYFYTCQCSQGYEDRDGRCHSTAPDVTAAVLGTLAGVLVLQAVFLLAYRTYTRQRRLQADNALKDQLLMERNEEVMALKRAWEIEYDELRLVERVAAGAFGVVFKAEWDTVTVAVKVLQQGVMMFDESTVLEFEKEVEFLQRTRHPNVVRFFGAGTDPNGSPFLVLEYVALGSLKDLLGKDMKQVLKNARNESADGGTDASVIAEDFGEELTLVSTGRDRSADTITVWELKLRLLRDVAGGMAFIHSLDQMHRDLKSGNVLVSSSLRAKITDFGSIRQCFTRDRNQHKQRTRLSSSSDADPQYTQEAGLQTMTSMTLTAGVGTPLYMAPEALTGDKYSFEADIFSFGVLMWEVATQRVPDLIEQEKGSEYRGPILATLFNLMADGKRLTFDDDEQDAIPEWFQSLTYKCMAQDPRERPSFGELKDHHFP
ncbi:TKL protein kinase [Salpingoeca rosetta]|uniref:TKL protein kinase n=1 Tax=Salpingoeca rosetta (strain ATCC 50818 / BSB-021) TaxID=946362 RepID=F2UN70_SALR5|nr:TKL protein kinase [Salpingoeca rosetta]EGD78569.1 TKL protein kinase [Salpingoeca rosetta]|eukprot:XP_004989518.1 TKL protein kinase [Salpingoeca rosetta]